MATRQDSTERLINMPSFNQLDAHGRLRHLISLEGLPADTIHQLLDRAQTYVRRIDERPAQSHALTGCTVANIFTEPSTRTRASFELAARRLGAEVLNLEIQLSSRMKGETILDTIHTLQAMSMDAFVIRDAQPGVCRFVAENVAPHVSVLSAGEAHLSHPTQGLLDALTIIQHKPQLGDLTLAVVGDIRHSRVARSAHHVFTALGIGELRIVAPDALMPESHEMPGAKRFDSIENGIRDADVIMMLRIQKERMEQADIPDGDQYFAQWGLTEQRLSLAQQDVIVLHPGPMNREIEIASSVADGKHSVIRQQVTNGVAVRMAVLESVITTRQLARGIA